MRNAAFEDLPIRRLQVSLVSFNNVKIQPRKAWSACEVESITVRNSDGLRSKEIQETDKYPWRINLGAIKKRPMAAK